MIGVRKGPEATDMPPDGKRVLVPDLEGAEVVVIDAAARKEIKRMKLGRSLEGILMAPDSSRA